jgi:sarcosine oxidase subunit delta
MLWLDCPRCGRRPIEEFTDPDERDFDEVWVFENPDGETTERWFHANGCRRWLTVRRDTDIDQVVEIRP